MENKNLIYIPISELHPHPDNPRKDLGELSELAESIKANGIFQNLTVVKGHKLTDDEWRDTAQLYKNESSGELKESLRQLMNSRKSADGYTVIIGHRRLAAAKLAGLTELPCAIVEMTPQEQVSTMLVENIQRSDLTVYEQAQGFQLMLDMGGTVETISEKSGFSHSTIHRRLKLLELDPVEFKASEQRGATLSDYAELDKIKDKKLKNTVLKSIGTNNFRNELHKAIEEEKKNKRKAEIIKKLSSFAKEIEKPENNHSFAKYYSYYDSKEVTVPDDSESNEYFYRVESYGISLYKKTESAEQQPDPEAVKQEKRRKKLVNGLKEVSNRAYDLRKEFADNLYATVIKKNLADIVAFWLYYCAIDDGIWISKRFIKELLGADDAEEVDYSNSAAIVGSNPEKYIWRVILLCIKDDPRKTYFNGYSGAYQSNKRLTDYYALLQTIGYQMSDEEIQLRDGTHELFKGEQ